MGKTSERKHWDEFWFDSRSRGDVYSTDFRIVRRLAEHISFNNMLVLEVGAGTGKDSAAVAREGSKAVALDYSEESLRLMEDFAGLGPMIVCGDAFSLPFQDASFDVVFHQGLLEHFRNPLDLLAENKRVLKEGGLLLVDVPQKYHYYTLLKHLLMFIGKWFAGWETEYSRRRLCAVIRDSGFDVEKIYGENPSPPVWYRGLRKILLKFRFGIPMYPQFFKRMSAAGRIWQKHFPRLYTNTAMVIGAAARKPGKC